MDLPDIISGLPGWLQITIAFFALFALVWTPLPRLLIKIMGWPMHKLWPKREDWSADCNEKSGALDPNNAWSGGSANKWSHQKQQMVSDYFILDIRKPRVIERITLVTEGPRHPTKYKISIKPDETMDWEDLGDYDILDARLIKPRKVVAIKWTITTPTNHIWPDTKKPAAWAIFDIRLTEVRLFSRWCRKIIRER